MNHQKMDMRGSSMGEPRIGVDRALIAEATNWFSLMRSGDATPEDRLAFEKWRNADPRHAAAYEHALSVWEDIGEFDDLKELAAAPEFGRAERRPISALAGFAGALFSRRRLVYGALAAVVVLALILPAIVYTQPAWLLPNVYATRTAETDQIELPDGSVSDLGPASKMRVAYSKSERRIFLMSGEAFFDVRKGDARAFIVSSGEAEVRVTGTKFNVHQGPTSVTVAVAEGIVEVRRRTEAIQAEASDKPVLRLSAGQQTGAIIGVSGFTKVIETPSAKVGAWRTGRLSYVDATLRDVIADANRYTRIPIIVADDSLLDMKLVAAFSTDQIDSMIDGLPEILPLKVDRSRPGRVVLRANGDRAK